MSRRNPEPKPHNRVRVSIPDNVSPHVKLVFAEMARQGWTYDRVEEKSGVLRATTKAWRHKNAASLQSLEAVLGALGWDFVPIPRKALPPEIAVRLEPIAESLQMTMPQATAFVLEVLAGIHRRFGDPRQDVVVPLRAARKRRVRWMPHPDQVPLLEISSAAA